MVLPIAALVACQAVLNATSWPYLQACAIHTVYTADARMQMSYPPLKLPEPYW
jgi:hypothetical protein